MDGLFYGKAVLGSDNLSVSMVMVIFLQYINGSDIFGLHLSWTRPTVFILQLMACMYSHVKYSI
jgi:hypothetical protein